MWPWDNALTDCSYAYANIRFSHQALNCVSTEGIPLQKHPPPRNTAKKTIWRGLEVWRHHHAVKSSSGLNRKDTVPFGFSSRET